MSTTRTEQYASGVLTTANQLTILRIVFVPVFIILLVYGQTGWALTTFIAAGITDALDGIIARRFAQKTTIGAYLDPIADKLLMTSTVVILSLPQMDFANLIPRWLLVIMISRDIFIFILTIVLLAVSGFQIFPPSIYGKASTILQGGTMLAVLICNWRGVAVPQLLILYFLTGLITAVSGLHYLVTKALK
jgi:cardiolipin synthase (CMP-forming)